MSETTGITVSNFLAGLIATGLALVIIPNIVEAQIGGASQSQNTDSLGQLVSSINQTCNGDVTTADGTVELTGDAVINLTEDEVRLEADGDTTERVVGCSIRESAELDGTEIYTVEEVDGGQYDIR